jgi:hypothetical protein
MLLSVPLGNAQCEDSTCIGIAAVVGGTMATAIRHVVTKAANIPEHMHSLPQDSKDTAIGKTFQEDLTHGEGYSPRRDAVMKPPSHKAVVE